jgi:hypothetical protein
LGFLTRRGRQIHVMLPHQPVQPLKSGSFGCVRLSIGLQQESFVGT